MLLNFLNGSLHIWKAITFLLEKIMKYLNTGMGNKMLGLFIKLLLSLSALRCFVLLGETKATFLGLGSIWDGDILLLIIGGGVFVVLVSRF